MNRDDAVTADPLADLDGLVVWLYANEGYDGRENDPRWKRWAAAVAALEPYIAARIAADRERLAAAVEAEAARVGDDASRGGEWMAQGLIAAAHIVRSRP